MGEQTPTTTKGIREVGYGAIEKEVDPQDFVRFGKKVNYENKVTND